MSWFLVPPVDIRNGLEKLGMISGSCLSIDFEIVSINMGQDFSIPIKPTTRLVLKKTQTRKFEL